MNADLFSICTKAIPVESANAMSIVERYYNPVRRAHFIIKEKAPDANDDLALRISVKAVNISVGPGGINLTLAVYGAIPRLGLLRDHLVASNTSASGYSRESHSGS